MAHPEMMSGLIATLILDGMVRAECYQLASAHLARTAIARVSKQAKRIASRLAERLAKSREVRDVYVQSNSAQPHSITSSHPRNAQRMHVARCGSRQMRTVVARLVESRMVTIQVGWRAHFVLVLQHSRESERDRTQISVRSRANVFCAHILAHTYIDNGAQRYYHRAIDRCNYHYRRDCWRRHIRARQPEARRN